MLPYARRDIYRAEVFRILQEHGFMADYRAENLVYQSFASQEIDQNAAYDNLRNKMRQVRDGLHRPTKSAPRDLVEQKRQYDRRRKRPHQVIHADQERIADEPEKIVAGNELLKVFQPDPRAAENAPGRPVVPKGDRYARHRAIAKNEIIGEADEGDKIYLPVNLQIPG